MRLSHSGLNCFNECNYRYFLEYIVHREADYDVEEKDYFVYGSDLHNLLSKHIKNHIINGSFLSLTFDEARADFNIKDEVKQIKIYFSSLIFVEQCTALFKRFPSARFLCTEQEVVTDTTKLILDTILEIEDEWFIVDFKSSGKKDYMLPAKLYKQPQLLHYACHKEIFKDIFKIKSSFGGVMFWIFYKTLHKLGKANSTISALFSHLKSEYQEDNGKFVSFLIAHEKDLRYSDYWEEYEKSYKNVMALYSMKPNEIIRNYSNCVNSYGNRCKFWSACYEDKTFTECKKNAKEANVLSMLFESDVELF